MTPHPPAPSRPARARWLLAIAVGWAVLLGVLAYVSARHDEPTVREQRSIGQARPVVDRALADLIDAAGPDVVVEVGAHRLNAGCRITPLRSGASLTRQLTVYTGESGAVALLERVADALPDRYGAWTRSGKLPMLKADAGEFVGVRGEAPGPDQVVFTVSTGCRPADGSVVESTTEGPEDEARRLLVALGASGIEPEGEAEAPCPAGGRTVTVRAAGRAGDSRPLAEALRATAAGGDVVLDTPERFVYRTPERGVVVERADDTLRVGVTVPCR